LFAGRGSGVDELTLASFTTDLGELFSQVWTRRSRIFPELSEPSGHLRKSVVGLNVQPEAPSSRLNHT